jgi:predicted NAD/FAD-binding protein
VQIAAVRPVRGGVEVVHNNAAPQIFDKVLVAVHSDQALALLPQAREPMRRALRAIPYRANTAVLHTDARLMPRRTSAWSSWNYVGNDPHGNDCAVTYWMNCLQGLQTRKPLFVSLNPTREPDHVLWRGVYEHPVFTTDGLKAQKALWTLQGVDGIWVAGAWCGAGFHEDGLQAGLAAAEAMGGMRRPWRVPDDSGRIYLSHVQTPPSLSEAA